MSNLKTIVRGGYDIQKLCIQMGNRIVGNFKAKLGQGASEKEEDSVDQEGKDILNKLRSHYKNITEGVVMFPRHAKFKGDEVISDYTELCLVSLYSELKKQEKAHFARLGNILKDYPVYELFLRDVKGVGPAMAGVIISEIDIHKAKYSSSLWAYAGLDVADDGAGRSRRKEHLREYTYVDKQGDTALKKGITFNPFLKTKLVGVLGSSFLRVGENKYSKIYYYYKNRLENNPKHNEKSKGHRHNMAIRYMIKIFLIDLYVEWRTIEKLPVHPPYHEAKLGLHHRQAV